MREAATKHGKSRNSSLEASKPNIGCPGAEVAQNKSGAWMWVVAEGETHPEMSVAPKMEARRLNLEQTPKNIALEHALW